MKIISCPQCGVVLDQENLSFDEWLNGDYVPATAEWDGEEYLPTAKCPVCYNRIVKRGAV